MDETFFFVVGIALTLLALAVAFLGLRSDRFPGSRAALNGTLGIFAALVVATAAGAVINARAEQEHREQERNEAGAERSGEEAVAEEEMGADGAQAPAGEAGGGAGDVAQGKQIFVEAGCGGCHILADAGTTGTTGPDLDDSLAGQTAEMIRTSIVDPDARVVEGFPPGVMPQTYGEDLTDAEIDALVAYLAQQAGP